MDRYKDSDIDLHFLFRKFYTGKYLIFVFILLGLSLWEVLDSFQDKDGDRLLAILPVITPGIFALWQILLILKVDKEKLTKKVMEHWFLFTALLGSLPITFMNVLFLIVAWLIPTNRELVLSIDYRFWWEMGLGLQLLNVGLI